MAHRRCIVINMRSAITLILIFVLSGIRNSGQSDSKAEGEQKDTSNKNELSLSIRNSLSLNESNISCGRHDHDMNHEEEECSSLQFPCIRCVYNYSCFYGRDVLVNCSAQETVTCKGERSFQRQMNCRYCYQTEPWQQNCAKTMVASVCNNVNDYYKTNCTVLNSIPCLGNRSFTRNVKCNYTQGYRWSTALLISLTLGGFGADRFYLGHWQEGIGKLFSFGGLGVWTIIDVLLISLHYLGPADGSLYL